MKVDQKGLLREPHGKSWRWRVRVEGDKRRRITIPCGPDDPRFPAIYAAARAGIAPVAQKDQEPIKNTLRWLCDLHLGWLERQVSAGKMSQKTLKSRRTSFNTICAEHGDKRALIPPHALKRIEGEMADRPEAFAALKKNLSAMYSWGIDHGYCDGNPLTHYRQDRRDKRERGARPWKPEHFAAYFQRHPWGSTASLCLNLIFYTGGCRIGDASVLGRRHIETRQGRPWLAWQPLKRGSAPMAVPLAGPLAAEIDAQKVVGPTFLLNAQGRPFASPDAMSQRFSAWCREAGLDGMTAHGVRKAVAHILAQQGASGYAIAAALAHTDQRTTAIYTAAYERDGLSVENIKALEAVDWRRVPTS
jgi:integrase